MRRAAVLVLPLLGALGRSPAAAQQPVKVYRVGVLVPDTSAVERAAENAFLRTLSGSGYQRGKNLEVIYRAAAGDAARLPELAAELVRAKPDAIVADGGQPTMASIQHATTSVPVVMVGSADPVAYGFVASLARPGGNITGVSGMALELNGKRLQLLEELVPHVRRVAVIRDPASGGNVAFWRVAQSTASKLGIAIVAVDVRSSEQVAGVAGAIARQHVDGILVFSNPVTRQNAAGIVRAIQSVRLPAVYSSGEFTANGGLLFYGASGTAMWSQAATYVARILKGARPADLPVQQPTTFELAVNLKTAHMLGITVPESVLLQATQVIQ